MDLRHPLRGANHFRPFSNNSNNSFQCLLCYIGNLLGFRVLAIRHLKLNLDKFRMGALVIPKEETIFRSSQT